MAGLKSAAMEKRIVAMLFLNIFFHGNQIVSMGFFISMTIFFQFLSLLILEESSMATNFISKIF
jgi:hypothetical protein